MPGQHLLKLELGAWQWVGLTPDPPPQPHGFAPQGALHFDAQVFCLDGPKLEMGRFNFSSALCEPAAHLASAHRANSNSKVNVSKVNVS